MEKKKLIWKILNKVMKGQTFKLYCYWDSWNFENFSKKNIKVFFFKKTTKPFIFFLFNARNIQFLRFNSKSFWIFHFFNDFVEISESFYWWWFVDCEKKSFRKNKNARMVAQNNSS